MPISTNNTNEELKENILDFIDNIRSFSSSLMAVSSFIEMSASLQSLIFNNKLNQAKNTDPKKTDKNGVPLKFDLSKLSHPEQMELTKTRRQIQRAQTSHASLPKALLVSMVSHYDVFLSKLIKILILSKPEILNKSERTLTLKELQKYESIEEAKEYILEKEIESVIRESHREHFSWLQRKFDIKLKEGLSIWPQFVELTQRRNLFTHCDGVISSQYLDICNEEKVKLDPTHTKGTQLYVTKEYIQQSQNCLIEVAFKLSYTLSRKLLPESKDQSDSLLINIAYNLIVDEEFDVAISILSYGIMVMKKYKGLEKTSRTAIINLAQSYKWKGDNRKCIETINEYDWTACSLDLNLAKSVLIDDFDAAIKTMKQIGTESETISKEAYIEWPLFRELREKPEFQKEFENIYKTKYPTNHPQTIQEQLIEIMSELNTKQENEEE